LVSLVANITGYQWLLGGLLGIIITLVNRIWSAYVSSDFMALHYHYDYDYYYYYYIPVILWWSVVGIGFQHPLDQVMPLLLQFLPCPVFPGVEALALLVVYRLGRWWTKHRNRDHKHCSIPVHSNMQNMTLKCISTLLCVIYQGRPKNKFQNGIILWIFKIAKIRDIRFVGNLFLRLSTSCEFYYDDVTCSLNKVSWCRILPTSILLNSVLWVMRKQADLLYVKQ